MNKRLLLLVFCGSTFGVEMMKDDSLCRESVASILGKNAHDSEKLVAALIQLDATFGITPCQYNKQKGISLGDAADSDWDNHYQQASESNNPAQQAIAAMNKASDSGSYSGSSSDLAAFKAGEMIGRNINPVKLGGIAVNGINVGVDASLHGISTGLEAVARSIGIPNLNVNLDVFKSLSLEAGGKWLYKGGQGLYDITSEGMANTYDFFSGVGQAVGSGSGRRRVVYDSDCDNIQSGIDSIESKCESYRYDKLNQLFPALQSGRTLYFGLNTDVQDSNNTYYGDPLSFSPGVQEMFTTQKNTLYGPGGTCLNPTKGSIAAQSSALNTHIFETASNIEQSFDTHWINLDNIDESQKTRLKFALSLFANETVGNLGNTGEAATKLVTSTHSKVSRMVQQTGSIVTKIAQSINQLQAMQTSNLGSIADKTRVTIAMIGKQTDRLLASMETISDFFFNAPNVLGDSANAMLNRAKSTLSSGQNDAQTTAADQGTLQVTNPGTKLLDVFDSNFASALNQALKAWTVSLRTIMSPNAEISSARNEADKSAILRQNADVAAKEIFANLDDLAVNNTLKFTNAQKSSTDSAAATNLLHSQTDSLRVLLKKLFAAVISGAKDNLANTQTKIANALGETQSGTADQFSALSESVAEANTDLTDQINGLVSQFSSLVASLTSALAKRQSSDAVADADQASSVQSAKALADAQLQTTVDSHSAQIAAASNNWEKLGDEALSGLDEIASTSEDQHPVATDSQTALRAVQSGLADGSAETQLAARAQAAAARRGLEKSSAATAALTSAAGADLSTQRDQLEAIAIDAANARSALSSDPSSDQEASLAASLARSLTSSSDSYASSFQQAKADAGAQLDKSTSRVVDKSDAVASEYADKIAEIQATFTQQTSQQITPQVDLTQLQSAANDASAPVIDYSHSLTDGLASAARSGASAVAGTVVSMSDSMNSLSESTAADLQRIHPGIPQIHTPSVDRLDNTLVFQNVDSTNANIALTIQQAVDLMNQFSLFFEKGAFDEKIDSLKTQNDDLSKIRMDQISNLISNFSDWNVSSPKRIDLAIAQFIDTMTKSALPDIIVPLDDGNAGFTTGTLSNLNQLQIVANQIQANNSKNSQNLLQETQNQIDDLAGISQKIAHVQIPSSSFQPAQIGLTTGAMSRVNSQLDASVAATQSSLSMDASRAASDSSFNATVMQGRSQVVSQLGAAAVATGVHAASETADTLQNVLGSSKIDLGNLQSTLAAYSANLHEKLLHSISQLSTMDSGVTNNLTADKSQTDLQLLMAKRAVRQLLDSWNQYAQFETKKFRAMNVSDAEHTALLSNKIESANSTAGTTLRTSRDGLGGIAADVRTAVTDFVSFKNHMQSGIDNYKTSFNVFNKSSDLAAAQMKEAIYNLNANDQFVDQSNRDQLATVIKNFEAQLDRQAKMAEAV